MTRIKNKYVRRESNQTEKRIESNQTETAIESNQIENRESNRVKNSCQHGTVDSDYGSRIGYLMKLWAGSGLSSAVLAVIVTAAKMHEAVACL